MSGWGTDEGLHHFDPATGVFTQLNSIGRDNPDIAIGADGTIWVTSFGSLIGWDPVAEAQTTTIFGGYRAVAAEPGGTLIVSGWGAQEGLHRFDPTTGVFTQLNSIGPDNPDIAIGTDGTIWMTNFGSLIGWDPVTGAAKTVISGGYRSVAVSPVPEPGTLVLVFLGCVALSAARMRMML